VLIRETRGDFWVAEGKVDDELGVFITPRAEEFRRSLKRLECL
jgi:hypothetical protein